jgi:hypothetical protein
MKELESLMEAPMGQGNEYGVPGTAEWIGLPTIWKVLWWSFAVIVLFVAVLFDAT